MDLKSFIEQVGDEEAAKLFGVKVRTAMSWRLRDRLPRPKQAALITQRSPVTYEGIYGQVSEIA